MQTMRLAAAVVAAVLGGGCASSPTLAPPSGAEAPLRSNGEEAEPVPPPVETGEGKSGMLGSGGVR